MKILVLFWSMAAFLAALQAEERIVALSPCAAEMCLVLQAKQMLCGRCSACRDPELSSLPVAGEMGLPSLETLFSLHPTLIVTDVFWPSEIWLAVDRAGIRVLRFSNEKLSDYPANLRTLGKILRREKAAEKAASRYEAEIAALRQEVPAEKLRVLLLFSLSPIVSCGKESFLTQALFLAGGESITGGLPGSYFALSPEMILSHPPDVIVAAGVSREAVQAWFSRPEYRQLPAVRKENILVVDPDSFCRSGPHFPAAIRRLRGDLNVFRR